jgi:5-methylcytosine-specific restriction enzyme subunit McrC
MWRIFEDFVCVALKEAMAGRGRARLQHQMNLDRAGEVPMKPDFLWTSLSGRQVVVDAKYKAEKPEGFPNADLYQLLAYCTVLELQQGHLVYAKGNDDPAVHRVVGADVTIKAHTLDLTRPPEELLAQVKHLADELAAAPALHAL